MRKYIESTTGALEKHISSMKEYISWDIIGGDPGRKKPITRSHIMCLLSSTPYHICWMKDGEKERELEGEEREKVQREKGKRGEERREGKG